MSTLTPGIFWYWNATPDALGIREQLTAMREAGFRCVYLHPMPDSYHKHFFFQGMECEYLGRQYFELAHVMLDECRRLGMTMMLYDEGGWPSGSVVDTLTKRHPECRVRAMAKDGDGVIRQIFLDIPDLCNPETTDRFIAMTHERYFAEFGEAFGTAIRGIFTDEPFWECYTPKDAVGIPPGLEAELSARYDVSLEAILPALFPDAPECSRTRQARRQYSDCCTALFERNYVRRCAQWCHRHHLEFEGHFLYEDLFFRCGFFYDFPRIMSSMDVPGVDAIFRMVYPHGGNGNFARLAQSAAIRGHRREALCECFNVYGYALGTPAMAYVANLLITKGINRILTMPFLYSDLGMLKIGCSSDFSPRTPIWRQIRPLNRHLHWLGQFDTGAMECDVRLLAVTGCYGGSDILQPLPEAVDYADRVDALMEKLDDALVFWRVMSPDELQDDARRPKTLILPGPVDDSRLRAAIDRWRQAGTAVIDGFAADDFSALSWLRAAETPHGIRILPCRRHEEGASLVIFNKSDAEQRLAFSLPNGACREIMPPDDAFSRLHPLRRDGDGVCSLRIPAWGVRVLQLLAAPPSHDAPDADAQAASSQATPAEERRLTLKWRLRGVERLRLSRECPTCYEHIDDQRPLPDDGMYTTLEPDFSGTVILEADFESDSHYRGFIQFDRLCWGGTLVFNQRVAGCRAFAPWLYAVEVQDGRNHIVLEVNSTAGNEWKRCFREELEPAGWYNDYINEIRRYDNDFAECGAGAGATLYRCGC